MKSPTWRSTESRIDPCSCLPAANTQDALGCAGSLFAPHHPQNAASGRVLEKFGFPFTHEELYPPAVRAREVIRN